MCTHTYTYACMHMQHIFYNVYWHSRASVHSNCRKVLLWMKTTIWLVPFKLKIEESIKILNINLH